MMHETPVLYQPKGRAGEYAAWAVNLFQGCPHGCDYCYAAALARRWRGQTTRMENAEWRMQNGNIRGIAMQRRVEHRVVPSSIFHFPFSTFHSPGDRIAASLTLLDEADARAWEPGAAPPAERIALLEAAKARGLTTWASLESVIDPAQTLAIIRQTADAGLVDHYRVGTLNGHPHARTVDWRAFARDVRDLLDAVGTAYTLKADLRRWL